MNTDHLREENKVLFHNKELLLSLFTSSEFSKKNSSKIDELLYGVINNLPKISDKESKDLINEYFGLVFQLVNRLPENEVQEAKPYVLKSFNEIWKLIILYVYSGDTKPYRNPNFDPEVAKEYFRSEIDIQQDKVIKQLSRLDSLIPTIPEPEDENYKKLKRLVLGKGRFLTPEESKQKKKELEQMTSSELFRKFGL